MTAPMNPPWFDGLMQLAGDGYATAGPAFIRAAAAQESFLADIERLITAPGATREAVEQAAAGILALVDQSGAEADAGY